MAGRAGGGHRPTRRLPLGSLRVFVAVAQDLSFTRAADALGVTPSAASLQVRALEEYLGRQLFRRNGRQVSLTTEGEALLPRVQQALEELERAVDDVRADRLAGPLRVSMLTSFLHQWLLPRLPRFHNRHPEIDLHVHTDIRTVDFVREEFHAAIRFGNGQWPGVASELLMEEWLIPVCAPALLQKHGPVREQRDLRRYPLLHSTTEPWTDWPEGGGATGAEVAPASGSAFDDSVAIVRSAVHGHGLALARWSLVADEVASGALVVASRRVVKFRRSYWFVTPARVQGLPAVRDFKAWLMAEATATPRPPGKRTL